MMQGGFPVDLILLALVAVFLVLRLRSVLGRRTGFERPPQPEGRPAGYDPLGRAAPAATPPAAPALAAPAGGGTLPDPASPLGQTLGRIAALDKGFEPARFLAGAETAFRMIIQAFAAGDRATLRPLLSDETMARFEGVIAARETAGEAQRTELRAINEVALDDAVLSGRTADLTVRFVTDQINLTTGRDGTVTHGSDAVTELRDLWTFQRDLGSADPTWRLVATRSL